MSCLYLPSRKDNLADTGDNIANYNNKTQQKAHQNIFATATSVRGLQTNLDMRSTVINEMNVHVHLIDKKKTDVEGILATFQTCEEKES